LNNCASRTGVRYALDAVILTCVSMGALYATARATLAPRQPELGVAVVFAPWTGADVTLTRTVEAGGRFVRFGGVPFVAVAIPDDQDYASRVLTSGAWLVVDPKTIAACLSAFGLETANP
jgi:hypothetical protein